MSGGDKETAGIKNLLLLENLNIAKARLVGKAKKAFDNGRAR
jgi:hypothetical protein